MVGYPLSAVLLAAGIPAAAALENGLARTPPMGCDAASCVAVCSARRLSPHRLHPRALPLLSTFSLVQLVLLECVPPQVQRVGVLRDDRRDGLERHAGRGLRVHQRRWRLVGGQRHGENRPQRHGLLRNQRAQIPARHQGGGRLHPQQGLQVRALHRRRHEGLQPGRAHEPGLRAPRCFFVRSGVRRGHGQGRRLRRHAAASGADDPLAEAAEYDRPPRALLQLPQRLRDRPAGQGQRLQPRRLAAMVRGAVQHVAQLGGYQFKMVEHHAQPGLPQGARQGSRREYFSPLRSICANTCACRRGWCPLPLTCVSA